MKTLKQPIQKSYSEQMDWQQYDSIIVEPMYSSYNYLANKVAQSKGISITTSHLSIASGIS